MNDVPCVGVWRHRWLQMSETFIRDQVGALQRWRALKIGFHQLDPTLVRADVAPFADSIVSRAGRHVLPPRVTYRKHREALTGADARLLHAHFATEGPAVVPLARSLRLPLVVTCHGFDVTASLSGRAQSRRAEALATTFGYATRVIAVSDFIAHRLVQLGVPAHKIVVHRIGIRTNLSVGEPTQDSARSGILFVGRFVEKKGLEDLFRAYASLPADVRLETPLLLAGDGDERPRLERLARDLNIVPTFLGWSDPASVRRLMQTSAVFCGPSRTASDGDSEGFGMVYLEAAACGLPSVAYRHGGVPEAVVDGQTGLLFDEGDVGGLADGLLAVLSDRSLAKELGTQGRDRVLLDFDISRTTAALESIYDESANV